MQKLRKNHQKIRYINCPIDVNMTKCSCCCCRSRHCGRCRRHHHRSRCHLIRRHHIRVTKIAPAPMYESCCWSYVKCFRLNRSFKCFLVFSFIFVLYTVFLLFFTYRFPSIFIDALRSAVFDLTDCNSYAYV